MPANRTLSDLRGTRLPSFGVQDADLTRVTEGLALDNDKWLLDGLGSLGAIYDLGNVTAGFSFRFDLNGARQKVRLDAGITIPFTITSGHAPESGWHAVRIENASGGTVTPQWAAHFDFGSALPPVIPDGTFCVVHMLWDAAEAVAHCVHNCPTPITPGVTYTDTGIFVCGGAKLGAVIDTAKIANTIDGICTGEYDYSTADDWQLIVHPTPTTGAFELDVRKRAWGNTMPGGGDSVCAAAPPILTANGTDFTASGATSTWTGAPIYRGDMLSIAPVTNTALITWWALYIPARRTF